MGSPGHLEETPVHSSVRSRVGLAARGQEGSSQQARGKKKKKYIDTETRRAETCQLAQRLSAGTQQGTDRRCRTER